MIYTFPFLVLRCPVSGMDRAYELPERMPLLLEEGIYLSSADLYNEIQRQDPKTRDKVRLAYAKYWIRSCTRCTPFATLAGTALVRITEGTSGIVLDEQNHKTRIRVDMNYLSGIITALTRDPVLRARMRFFINNSLYALADAFRYAEYVTKEGVRHYELTSVDKTGYLEGVLECAAGGATLETLSDLLVASEGVNHEEAMDFVVSLIDAQILVPELEPCITGDDPLDGLIGRLREWRYTVPGLEEAQRLIRRTGSYHAIEQALASTGLAVEKPRNALQADLYLGMRESHVSEALIRTVVDQVEDLHALSRPPRGSELEDFARKFSARFDRAEIPLAVALDTELGIPYGSSASLMAGGEWMEDLTLGGAEEDQRFTFDDIQRLALSKYDDYLRGQQEYIEISEGDLRALKGKSLRFPDSLYIIGSVLQQGNDFLFDLTGVGGPSAGNLLGRFTHGDQDIHDFTAGLLQQEEQAHPDILYAEIVHLPQARTGNVLLRPLLRSYEIPYVGRSGAPADRQIPLADLLVSVRDGTVVLRSKSHDRRVLPRLTTAHNYLHQSLPVYRFLCDLQNQGLAQPCIWDWGSLSTLPRLPRVVYKNIVLQKARWKVEEKDLPADGDFERFRQVWGLPQKVVYAEMDNKLLIDFGHRLGTDLLVHYLRRHHTIVLEEFLCTKENCIVRDAAGTPHLNEVIIPLYRKQTTAFPPLPSPEGSGKRKFSPYSEWLYFKIYCGPKTAENLLKTVIRVFVEEKGLFERFFFLRYKDETDHLRVRFYNTDADRQPAVYKAFIIALQPFLDAGLVSRVALDTYDREMERYGEDTIDAAETLFFHDSCAVLRFIHLLEGEDMEKYRLFFALRGTDMLLDDFGFLLPEKARLLKQLQGGFFAEFGGKPALQRQLNEKYRKYQKVLFSHMDQANDAANGIEEGVAIFRERSARNTPLIPRSFPEGFPASLIHMFLNRLFPDHQRTHELVVYHFLDKYYASQVAILKKGLELPPG